MSVAAKCNGRVARCMKARDPPSTISVVFFSRKRRYYRYGVYGALQAKGKSSEIEGDEIMKRSLRSYIFAAGSSSASHDARH
jgi:hypothetical protein